MGKNEECKVSVEILNIMVYSETTQNESLVHFYRWYLQLFANVFSSNLKISEFLLEDACM